MYTDTQVEGILSRGLGHVLVGANTSSFKCLTRKLFIFIGNEMAAEGELVNVGTFTTEIENPDFGVRNTTVVPGFGVRLVLAITVAASGTATHYYFQIVSVIGYEGRERAVSSYKAFSPL
jgi:hypothetical protein